MVGLLALGSTVELPEQHHVAAVRCIRINKGERHHLTPTDSFSTDGSIVLIYDGKHACVQLAGSPVLNVSEKRVCCLAQKSLTAPS